MAGRTTPCSFCGPPLRVFAGATGWQVPAPDQLDAQVLGMIGELLVVEVRVPMEAPAAGACVWGPLDAAAAAVPDAPWLPLIR